MRNARSTTAVAAVVLGLGLLTSACTRKSETVPVLETGTQTSAQGRVPMTVVGCLRAGEAADTFVLTTGGEQAVTYQLAGSDGAMLRDHIGRQIEAIGTVTDEQRTATNASGPAANKSVGTSGMPTVQTQTQVNLRRLEVSSLKRTGAKCK